MTWHVEQANDAAQAWKENKMRFLFCCFLFYLLPDQFHSDEQGQEYAVQRVLSPAVENRPYLRIQGSLWEALMFHLCKSPIITFLPNINNIITTLMEQERKHSELTSEWRNHTLVHCWNPSQEASQQCLLNISVMEGYWKLHDGGHSSLPPVLAFVDERTLVNDLTMGG